MRILIVEDEVRLAEALGEIMKAQRYTTDIVYDGESAFDNAMSGIYDCIILDVMIPKMDGFEVVRKMRQEKNTTPVIMLTAKDDTVDKIKCLFPTIRWRATGNPCLSGRKSLRSCGSSCPLRT